MGLEDLNKPEEVQQSCKAEHWGEREVIRFEAQFQGQPACRGLLVQWLGRENASQSFGLTLDEWLRGISFTRQDESPCKQLLGFVCLLH